MYVASKASRFGVFLARSFSRRPALAKAQTDPPKAQLDRFRETARQLECDEDQERFEKKLGKIAKVKPGPKDGAKA